MSKQFEKMPKKLKNIHYLRNITCKTLMIGKIKYIKRLMMDDGFLPFIETEFLPRSSPLLINNFVSDILRLNSNMRNLVIVSHLYFENIIDELIRINFKNPKAIDNFNFYQKMKVIESIEILDSETIKFLILINKIRNKFAHNLEYDMPDSDTQEIRFFAVVTKRFNYKVKKFRMKRNYYMFAFGCIDVILNIIEQHPKIFKTKKI